MQCFARGCLDDETEQSVFLREMCHSSLEPGLDPFYSWLPFLQLSPWACADHSSASQDPITASVCLICSHNISQKGLHSPSLFFWHSPSYLLSLTGPYPVPLKAGLIPSLKNPTELPLRWTGRLRKGKQGKENYYKNSKSAGVEGSSCFSSSGWGLTQQPIGEQRSAKVQLSCCPRTHFSSSTHSRRTPK